MTGKIIRFPTPGKTKDSGAFYARLVNVYTKKLPELPAYRGLATTALYAMAEQAGPEEAARAAEEIAFNLRNPMGA